MSLALKWNMYVMNQDAVPSVEALFEPFNLPNLELKNRLVMAPMTRSMSPGGVPGDDVAAYYRRRVEGGLGLIITEGTTIDHPVASNDTNIPVFHGDEALSGWKYVVDQVHEAGGKIVPQLWHQGMARKPGTGWSPEAPSAGPSGLVRAGKQVAEPMSDDDVQQVINGFINAAKFAKEIGFDGVELHGAHGYLIDQFFWKDTNVRTDRYGGGIAERTRFACDIIKGIKRQVGSDFPLILRFSQWKLQDYEAKLANSPEELSEFLAPLVEAGVDIFHCSTRRFWEPEFEGSELNLAGWTKRLTGKPTMTVGSVGLDEEFIAGFMGTEAMSTGAKGVADLVARLEREEFDLVAIGRAVLVDSAWANKVAHGNYAELQPFNTEALGTLS